ncbi:MAG TPA: hypothetical protein VF089_15430, partial [Candidatus Binatia bacterium]
MIENPFYGFGRIYRALSFHVKRSTMPVRTNLKDPAVVDKTKTIHEKIALPRSWALGLPDSTVTARTTD